MHTHRCVLIEIGMINFWLGLLVTALMKETYFRHVTREYFLFKRSRWENIFIPHFQCFRLPCFHPQVQFSSNCTTLSWSPFIMFKTIIPWCSKNILCQEWVELNSLQDFYGPKVEWPMLWRITKNSLYNE